MSKRLDIALTSSYQVKFYWLLYMAVAVLIASRYDLVWWQWLVFVALCVWMLSLVRVREICVVGMVAPKQGDLWQLSVRHNEDIQIWQAKLSHIKHVDICIVCEFLVIEPKSEDVVVRIYPDQVNKEAWRQLNSLVSFE